MSLASLGHDDIQFWLMDIENRNKVLESLAINPLPSDILESERAVECAEYRIDLDYERPVVLDFYEERLLPDEMYWSIIWEIKPVLNDLGDTLRQLRRYQQIVKKARNKPPHSIEGPLAILLYNTSKIPEEIITKFFKSPSQISHTLVYRVLPNECKRLEDS